MKEKNNIKEDLLKTENLYQLKVGDMIVDMVYSDNNKKIDDCMLNILKLKSRNE